MPETTPPADAPNAGRPVRTDGETHRLSRSWVMVQRLSGLVTTVVLGFPLTLGGGLFAWLGPLRGIGRLAALGAVAALLALLLVSAVAWPPLEWKHRWYRVDADHIEIAKGVLWRRLLSVPLTRVQHTDVNQGPIERAFGLAHLVIHTAGTINASVTLEGLEYPRAIVLRDLLLAARGGDAV